jgi:KDO2-lipid IV(A) lauroyltransferase
MTASPKRTRRPYIWQPVQVPSLADIFAGPQGRRRFLAYWRKDGLLDLRDDLLFRLFRRLPIGFVSWLGGWICRLTWRNVKEAHKQLHDNLKIIRPDLDEAGRNTAIISYFDNIGRVIAEFSLLGRLKRAGRLRHTNGESLTRHHAEGPVILMGLHLANWEVTTLFSEELGVTAYAVNKPPARAAQARIAAKVRENIGLVLLPPGKAGARPMLRVLQSGGVLSIFGDEEQEGRTMAPFFGQPGHLNGNLAIIARLARMTGAKVMIYHGERRADGIYGAVFKDPVPLPSQTDPDVPLIDDVMALNAAIEPIIRAHCDNWYFLAYAHPLAAVTAMLQ